MIDTTLADVDIDLPNSSKANGGLPLSAIYSNYDPVRRAAEYQINRLRLRDEYHYEKLIGLRRSNGNKNLKKLRPVHERIIAAFVSGMTGVEIAAQFRCSAMTIYRILGDPLASSLTKEIGENYREEFKQLFPLVYLAVKDGLNSGSAKIRLSAVDRFARINRMIDGDSGEDAVESHVKRVIDARFTIIHLVRNAATKDILGEVIENEEPEAASSDQVVALDAPCPVANNMLTVPDDLTASLAVEEAEVLEETWEIEDLVVEESVASS